MYVSFTLIVGLFNENTYLLQKWHRRLSDRGMGCPCWGGGAGEGGEGRAEKYLAGGAVPRQVSMGGTTQLQLPAQTAPDGADHPTFRNARLMKVAASGDDLALRDVLAAGAELGARDEKGRTALMNAAVGGHTACVRVLLAYKADVRAGDSAGDTPLMGAAMQGHAECLHELLQAGASVRATTINGNTPLHLAAGAGHDACVRQLLAAGRAPHLYARARARAQRAAPCARSRPLVVIPHAPVTPGADIEARNRNGNTPFLWAARGGNTEVVSTLLEAGASRAACNNSGETALDLAQARGHEMCVRHGCR